MVHVIIIYMVFVIVTYYIYLDITDGTCDYLTHGVCYYNLLHLLRLNKWDMWLFDTWCLLLSLITFTET